MSIMRSRVGLLALVSTGLFLACTNDDPAPGGGPKITGGSSSTSGAGGGGPSGEGGGSSGEGGGSSGGTFTASELGANVFVFEPSMPMADIQSQIDRVFRQQETNQFGLERYALLFKPGQYDLAVPVGFYTHVIGLGRSPDDVTITGGLDVNANWMPKHNATQNFWRTAENLAVVPTRNNRTTMWAVSQATSLRRLHVKGSITLSDGGGWSSGGFIADSKIDTQISSVSQQQFLTRNSTLTSWDGGNWNMVFVGDEQPPQGAWPASPYTVIDTTPTVREKPYLVVDESNRFSVVVPELKQNSRGTSWSSGTAAGATVPIEQFYVAHADKDTADTMNAALDAGEHLLLTPGVYHLDRSLDVKKAGTIVLGLGLATLLPDKGTPAMTIADVDGVSVAGIVFDAGVMESPTMLRVGDAPSSVAHAEHPTALFDVSCRVGGASAGNATSCFTINSNDVLMDNVWLWRADHGDGVGWDVNKSRNGLIVNGNNVTAYGLFVEHFEEYQTLWNGNGGRVFFYQSEIPYDVPSQDRWSHAGVNGYASYKVADTVTSHEAWGLGVYCFFTNPVILENAFETPTMPGVQMHHMVTFWLNGNQGSAINHIINGTGARVDTASRKAQSPQ